ncbi:MAG: MBL fold metallo-hydrolase [Chloroflexi bacterium]|nr:MBL fold metallo-hydrolase [Chloroflexota bacterium]
MDITWYGGGSFALKGSELLIVTEPLDDSGKPRQGLPKADVFTLSRSSPERTELQALQPKRKSLAGPGEYEIAGVFINAVRTFRDDQKGAAKGTNTCYRYVIDGVRIAHLGLIGHVPTSDQAKAVGDIDVLIIPIVDGGLTAAGASETIRMLEAKIVIPAPQASAKTMADSPAVAKVFKELGVTPQPPVQKLIVNPALLSGDQRIMLLERAA